VPANACFLGRDPDGRDEVIWWVVWATTRFLGSVEMQDVSCHLAHLGFCFFLLWHSGVLKVAGVMKRVRFDAYDDPRGLALGRNHIKFEARKYED
jgi:hypothetical protein